MEILYLILGISVGALLSYLFLREKIKNSNKYSELESMYNILNLEKEKLIVQKNELEILYKELKEENQRINNENKTLISSNSGLEAEKKSMIEKIETQKSEIFELQKKLATEFENLANKIFEEKTKTFNELSKNQLDNILNPFNENLKEFRKIVYETYEKGLKERTELGAELKNMQELSRKLQIEANNLVNALKADSQKQGRWGEMLLERILESSGLIKGEHYTVQETFKGEESKNYRPDAIVKLPEDKLIIIDSKVSLKAYERYLSSEYESEKKDALKAHIESVKKHVKELSNKNYIGQINGKTPDYLLMFMPIEGAFSLAVINDKNIFNEAWENQIVIVSPSTLIATLMTVASIWKQTKQVQNALKIAEVGGKVYDKFIGFIDDMRKLEGAIDNAQKSFKEAKSKLSEGKGNILSQLENLKKLGAKAGKSIANVGFFDRTALTSNNEEEPDTETSEE
ncbi:MAG: DNA recombination protein RmuC [Bacteroidales bacterium]|jgi:DNA recombination protein RmuC|nr:DNA recombination protein RmuC [Bacteroidales bacterium]HOL98688.1 DNA recombination protein RmuC [Bacteroidales bacterium]HOM37131.1 DNA recombination protein RmuC [Bacteroidales bacterium]HPD24783.1 DNA recombination protein RmuC [Bacteroidales bacterium]HRT00529.1 DNA recombination protein RmuC [Bacteroidales bacterium]